MTSTGAPSVLIIEDDDTIREVVRLTLEDAGYVVEEAADGTPALIRLRTSQDRLVALLDLLMPGIDGLQVLQAAVAEPLVRRHAFILMTADGRPPSPDLSDVLARLQAPTLLKPFDVDDLLELVAAAVERLA